MLEFVETYAKPAALRVFGDAALPPVERNAAMLARHIQEVGTCRINARNLRRGEEPYQKRPPTLKDGEKLKSAIEFLVEADWLRPAPARAGASSGRLSSDYLVNPAIHGAADA